VEVELLPVAPVSIEADEAAVVVDGHLALMEQFLLAGAEVMESYFGQSVPSEPAGMPLLGTIVSYDPGEALVAERVIDLDSDAYLRDHTLGRTVSRADPALTALAVMPLTMSLEVLAEAGAALLPGLVVTGIREVRAHRWLVVGESPAMIEISALRLDSEGRSGAEVQVVLGELNDAAELVPVIEGVVQLDAAYPAPPAAATDSVPAGARACRFPSDRLYEDAMFHGPAWRGVRSVDWVSDTAAGATLAALPRDGMLSGEALPEFVLDPVLLDAAGQLIGFWTADQLERGHVVFPFRMAALDVFGPPPAAGELFECRAQIELEGEHLVRSDIDVIGADGLCRMRLRGWEDKRFDVPPAFAGLSSPASLRPLSADWPAPADATGAGRVACRRMGVELGADAGLWKQVWAGRVLGRRERELFGALTVPPRRQLEWLAARTAAKEAIIELVRELSGVELLPAEIEILRDERGAPIVVGLEVAGYVPVVSLTHSSGEAAAIATLVPAAEALRAGVGIDLERLTQRPVGFAQAVLSDRERPLLAELPEEQMEEWQLRCWCAKEAAGKAAGTGLVPATEDAPRVVAVDVARESVQVEASGRRTLVPTRREGNLIVATTVAEEARTA
jgi:phosphopantetheinyl transferase (holo-ACP synthase)